MTLLSCTILWNIHKDVSTLLYSTLISLDRLNIDISVVFFPSYHNQVSHITESAMHQLNWIVMNNCLNLIKKKKWIYFFLIYLIFISVVLNLTSRAEDRMFSICRKIKSLKNVNHVKMDVVLISRKLFAFATERMYIHFSLNISL